MLDDIGTKVDRGRLTLQPSWLLETSPGNYQAGYLLQESLTDSSMADRLMKAIMYLPDIAFKSGNVEKVCDQDPRDQNANRHFSVPLHGKVHSPKVAVGVITR